MFNRHGKEQLSTSVYCSSSPIARSIIKLFSVTFPDNTITTLSLMAKYRCLGGLLQPTLSRGEKHGTGKIQGFLVFHTSKQDVSRLLLQKRDRKQVFKNLTVRENMIPCMKEGRMPPSPKSQEQRCTPGTASTKPSTAVWSLQNYHFKAHATLQSYAQIESLSTTLPSLFSDTKLPLPPINSQGAGPSFYPIMVISQR